MFVIPKCLIVVLMFRVDTPLTWDSVMTRMSARPTARIPFKDNCLEGIFAKLRL